ncbi:hypothetical protein KJZ63_01290 [Patescibacteria group bacterium]|nr:hypothetical protein [Patescibacteria group bacterium]
MTYEKPVTSRLAKKEQKKLITQTALMFGLVVFLILAFLFFVLPNIVRIAFNVLDSDPIAKSEDTIPPQVPILAAPVEATYSAQVNLSGYGEAKSEIILVLNGNEADKKTIADDGTFSFDVTLTEGENSLATFSRDAAQNESVLSKKYTVVLDVTTPTIEIESPKDGDRITLRKNQITTIKGKTEPKARVFIDSRLVLADAEGNFQGSYNLQEGDNKIIIKATDAAGNQTEKELTVNFAY